MSIRRSANAYFDKQRRVLRDTFLSESEIARSVYDLIDSSLTPDRPQTEQWVDYRGHNLRIHANDFVSTQIFNYGVYVPEIYDTIVESTPPGGVAIDVGAHIGNYTLAMREAVGEEGTVMAFEPNPANAGMIRKTTDKNGFENVRVVEEALSSEPGSATLSIQRGENTGGATIEETSAPSSRFTVSKTTLDRVVAAEEISSIDFIKIDVEGHERSVVAGGRETMALTDNVMIELHDVDADDVEFIYRVLRECFDRIVVFHGHRYEAAPVESIDDLFDRDVRQVYARSRSD